MSHLLKESAWCRQGGMHADRARRRRVTRRNVRRKLDYKELPSFGRTPSLQAAYDTVDTELAWKNPRASVRKRGKKVHSEVWVCE